jgi:hypothetical protein
MGGRGGEGSGGEREGVKEKVEEEKETCRQVQMPSFTDCVKISKRYSSMFLPPMRLRVTMLRVTLSFPERAPDLAPTRDPRGFPFVYHL